MLLLLLLQRQRYLFGTATAVDELYRDAASYKHVNSCCHQQCLVMKTSATAQSALGSSSTWSVFIGFTATNYTCTFCREMGHPNVNADHLAALLRDKLMPLRMWWLKHAPGATKQFKKALEHKKLGCPGARYSINFTVGSCQRTFTLTGRGTTPVLLFLLPKARWQYCHDMHSCK